MERGVFILDNSENLNSSVLKAHYYPPIIVGSSSRICLLKYKTNFKIPNVSEKLKNNLFSYLKDKELITFKIPTGTYGINHLRDILEEAIGTGFVLTANTNTFKCEIKTVYTIDFTDDNSIGKLLGFNKRKLEADKKHVSDNEVDIFKIKSIRIHCPLAIGQRINSKHTDVIYDSYIKVNPGYDIIEEPKTEQYYSLIGKDTIDSLIIEIKDQDGKLIDFRGEHIEVQVKIKD